jgi:hypothetical protein
MPPSWPATSPSRQRTSSGRPVTSQALMLRWKQTTGETAPCCFGTTDTGTGAEALFKARKALEQNLTVWENVNETKWCETKNDLGGASWRLASFDVAQNAMEHLADAKRHFEDVLAICSYEQLPKAFATASYSLATVYTFRRLATSKADYEKNLQRALSLQLSALRHFSKAEDPREWGIVHHNIALSYISLSDMRTEATKSVADVKEAIHHAETSFEVRDPDQSLQYWVASCRTLGEALLKMSTHSTAIDSKKYVERASEVLQGAAARISPSEHPLQWEEIQRQLAKCC